MTCMEWSQCAVVDRHPDKVGGVWCFKGTRVPVAFLFEHLDDQISIEEFLDSFPSVTPEHVHGVLAFMLLSLDQQPAIAA